MLFLPVGVLKERDSGPSNSVKESICYALPMLPAFYFHLNYSLHPVWVGLALLRGSAYYLLQSLPILYLAGWVGMMSGQALVVSDSTMRNAEKSS